jgi:hypothetical protein
MARPVWHFNRTYNLVFLIGHVVTVNAINKASDYFSLCAMIEYYHRNCPQGRARRDNGKLDFHYYYSLG